ncbi:MAG TPA: hypothetical protein VG963_26865 [Polyangiaceae bacterium]|nr:hypothetical protein [Polyangiaceae bacterium]
MAQTHSLRTALGLVIGFSLSTMAGPVRASDTKDRVKGVAGGMLLGSEVVCMTGAAFGLEPAWAYGLGAAAGAALGGWAGYGLAGSTSARPSSFLLAGGIALVIPTLISVITATHLQEPETLRQEVPTDPPAPEGRLELPTLEVLPVFTRTELAEFGKTQATEVRLSLLRGVF